MGEKCIVCGASDFQQVYFQGKVPACNNSPLKKNGFESEIVGELDIVMCKKCSHVFNRLADPEIISRIYDKTDFSSGIPSTPVMLERYQHIITNALGEEHCKDKVILEVGASNFVFSELLLETGAAKIIAFEPANFHTENPAIIHVQDYYSLNLIPEEYTGKVDLIILRHVLEHITDPIPFIRDSLSNALNVGSKIYIELPDINDSLKHRRIYDFFYDHVSYFSPELLEGLLSLFGFKVLKRTWMINGQHFGLLCEKIRPAGEPDVPGLQVGVPSRDADIDAFKSYVSTFKEELAEIFKAHKSIAIYGAGAQGIAVANLLGLTGSDVRFMLDISELKENKYAPLSHILIQRPSEQIVNEVDAIVIVASLHQGAIHKALRQNYKFRGKIYGTYPTIFELK